MVMKMMPATAPISSRCLATPSVFTVPERSEPGQRAAEDPKSSSHQVYDAGVSTMFADLHPVNNHHHHHHHHQPPTEPNPVQRFWFWKLEVFYVSVNKRVQKKHFKQLY